MVKTALDEKTVILGTMKIHGRGRVQIPKRVRELLKIQDDDLVYFMQDLEGKISIEKVPQLVRGKY